MGVGDNDQYMEPDSPVSPAGSEKMKTPQAVVQPQTNNATGEFETSFSDRENTNNNHVLAQPNSLSLNSNGSLQQTPGVVWVPITQGQSLPQNFTLPNNAQQSPILLPPGVTPVSDFSQANPGYMVKLQQGLAPTPTSEPQMRFGMSGNRVSEIPTNVYEDLPDPPPRPSNLPAFNDSLNKRRTNPLYGESYDEPRSRSESPDNLRSQEEQTLVSNKQPHKKKRRCYCCCVVMMVLVCLILLGAATFSILLSLKIISIPGTGAVEPNSKPSETPAPIVNQPEISLLMEKIETLNKSMTDMNRIITAQNSELSSLKNNMFNISGCIHAFESKLITTELSPFYTPMVSTITENYVVISVTCSSDNTERHQLIFYQSSTPPHYRCSCSGKLNNTEQRICRLHYTKCPITPTPTEKTLS